MDLVVMVGLSGSGKSTFAQKLKEVYETALKKPVVIVSSDAIRAELFGNETDQTANEKVFAEVRKRVNNNIYKRNVIVDATNISLKSRRSILDVVNNVPNCIKIAYVMTTPVAFCKKQNRFRDRVVPDYVIDRQSKAFEIPFFEEGFNEVRFVTDFSGENTVSKADWGTDKDPTMSLMKGFDQKTRHHVHTLDVHCLKCAEEIKKRRPDDEILYRAALIHDIGKVFVGEPKEDGSGDYRYYGHHNYGAYALLQNMDAIGFTNIVDVHKCIFYVNYHMIHFFLNTDKAQKKWKNIFGEDNYNTLKLFNECDIIASGRG